MNLQVSYSKSFLFVRNFLATIISVTFFTACSTQLTLQSANVTPKSAAVLSKKKASYFIDKVNVPRMFGQRIGKKRNSVGDFLAWVYTDQTKLENWCENELKLFLQRHGKTVSYDFDKADYIIQCDIKKIWTEKRWQWSENDLFFAAVKMNITITERATNKKVFNDYLKFYFNTERAKERAGQISDEQMFNYCLSTAFQNALEKIKCIN